MLLGMEQARPSRFLNPVAAVTAEEFEELRRALEPPPDEPWRRIPWEISLLEARRTAAARGRPIMMVVWSGHPLGCT